MRKDIRTEYRKALRKIEVHLRELRQGTDTFPAVDGPLSWGDVGDARHFAAELEEIADQMLRRGEYKREEDQS